MYSWFEIFLQYLASVLIGGSTYYKSWDKKHMYVASWLSILGSITFTFYYILTQQWGLLPLNIYTVLMGIKAIHTWRKINENSTKN